MLILFSSFYYYYYFQCKLYKKYIYILILHLLEFHASNLVSITYISSNGFDKQPFICNQIFVEAVVLHHVYPLLKIIQVHFEHGSQTLVKVLDIFLEQTFTAGFVASDGSTRVRGESVTMDASNPETLAKLPHELSDR